MKSKDFIKILDENLQQSVQDFDQGWQFSSQQNNDLKCTSQSVTVWLKKARLQFYHGLQWVLTWNLLKIYGKNWNFE